ncbi:MAG: Universal stress protein family protein [Pelotomaculum sp. PtaB.Bin104]|nr:MAG: Universal stress protein family protein [Pelotomaculum sp. PtaB.Bin104]
MFNKLLVVYDGSPEAKKALKEGLKLAKMAGSECHLVRVLKKPKQVPNSELFRQEVASELTFAEKEFVGARFLASQAGIDLPTHTVLGEACEVLKNFVVAGHIPMPAQANTACHSRSRVSASLR